MPVKKIKQEPEETNEACTVYVKEEDSFVKEEESNLESEEAKENPFAESQDNPVVGQDYVQIVASRDELSRRIKAFQQHKREEIDVLNVQEFCTMYGTVTSHNSCARTSAVVLRSKDSNSHLKLTRVINEWGPQTLGKDPGSVVNSLVKQGSGTSSSGSSREGSLERTSSKATRTANVTSSNKEDVQKGSLPPGIDERIHNLENHLKLSKNSPVPRDVYDRLKAIENRVLHLEGISLEYFGDKKVKIPDASYNKREVKAKEDDLSLKDVNVRIHDLKMKLKDRQLKYAF